MFINILMKNKIKTIGITYDLREWYLQKGYSDDDTAEFDKEETLMAIEKEISSAGYEPVRIGNIFQLVEALARGDRWDMVFNIAECMYGDGREATVPALLDQYQIPYFFSGPVIMGISLNKYMAKLIAEAGGVPVCRGKLVRNQFDLQLVEAEVNSYRLSYPLFVKPVAEGTGKGITDKSIIHNSLELWDVCTELLKVYKQPVLVEEYLSGREFTVGVVGSGTDTRCVGGMEIICKDDLPYSNFVKENYEDYVEYKVLEGNIKDQCEAVAILAWQTLGGLDGGRIDLRADKNGRICFIEVNPLAGLNPYISDLPILARLNNKDYHFIMQSIISAGIRRCTSNSRSFKESYC